MAKIGILAQGQKKDIKKSLDLEIKRLGGSIKTVFIGGSDEFSSIDALVLPRGESLMYSELMGGTQLGKSIAKFSKNKPLLAICGSMITCAKRLGRGCKERKTIGIIDAKVDNDCLDGDLEVVLAEGQKLIGNFTDAPILCDLGKGAEEIARADGKIVAVRDGNVFGFSYVDWSGRSYKPFLLAVLSKR